MDQLQLIDQKIHKLKKTCQILLVVLILSLMSVLFINIIVWGILNINIFVALVISCLYLEEMIAVKKQHIRIMGILKKIYD